MVLEAAHVISPSVSMYNSFLGDYDKKVKLNVTFCQRILKLGVHMFAILD
jgi:hypothetical protein